MADVRAYLDRVADGLPFVEPLKVEVVTELADHIEDSIDELVSEGRSPDEAAARVLRQMGPPDELARSIVRAHQTPKRLLVAAGIGAISSVRFAISAGLQVVVLTVLLGGLVAFALGMVLPFELRWALFTAYADASLAVLWLAVGYAVGRGVPFAVARASGRSVRISRIAVAVVVALLAVWFLWFFYRVDLKWYAVVPLLLAPVAVLFGARNADGFPWAIPRFPSRAYLGLLAYVYAVGFIAILSAASSTDGVSSRVDSSLKQASLSIVGNVGPLETSRRFMTVHDRGASHSVTVEGERTDYFSIQAEVWTASADLSGVDASRLNPLAVAPLEFSEYREVGVFEAQVLGIWLFGPGETRVGYHGSFPDSLYRDWGPTYVVLVGQGTDGSRDVLDYRIPIRPIEFTGSVAEWLLAK